MSESDPRQPCHLSDADAAALDAVVGGSPGESPGGDSRALRVRALLDLLGTPVAGERERATRVDLAVLRARRAALAEARCTPEPTESGLCAGDAAALDRWMGERGADTPERARTGRIESLAALASCADATSDVDRSARVDRVMDAVRRQERERTRVLPIDQGPELSGWRLRLADLVSIAAMLLIGVSIVLPTANALNNRRQRLACMDNMRSSAGAFSTYANDHSDMLPMATAGFGGGSWMDVGSRDRSNSANLYTLVRTGYEKLDDLACAGNPHAARGTPTHGAWDWRNMDEISYSYRIMPPGGLRLSVPVVSPARVVVTADRSPVTLRIVQGLPVIPEANTPNHDGRGQHVLRLDGSTDWTRTPIVEGDNIWLPRPIERVIREVRARMGLNLQGTEIPESAEDAFVGP